MLNLSGVKLVNSYLVDVITEKIRVNDKIATHAIKLIPDDRPHSKIRDALQKIDTGLCGIIIRDNGDLSSLFTSGS
jgi:hypothetical protein